MRRLYLAAALAVVTAVLLQGRMNMAADTDTQLLRHVVLFQFKDGTTDAQKQELVTAFAALPGKISEIHDFEYGTDVSVENLAAGFSHGFLVTFKTAKDRDTYLPHPEHQKFVELAKTRVDKALVFDYWAKR